MLLAFNPNRITINSNTLITIYPSQIESKIKQIFILVINWHSCSETKSSTPNLQLSLTNQKSSYRLHIIDIRLRIEPSSQITIVLARVRSITSWQQHPSFRFWDQQYTTNFDFKANHQFRSTLFTDFDYLCLTFWFQQIHQYQNHQKQI